MLLEVPCPIRREPERTTAGAQLQRAFQKHEFDPARSKRTRYKIQDPVFRFYFRYLYGRGGQYELYGENAYTDLIEPELADFVSETFESLCHRAVPALYTDYQLTQVPSQWWYKGREVDVVAPTDESTLIAGEAKFTSTPLGYDVLSTLEDDVKYIDWTPNGGDETTYEFALFSRSGFKRSVEEAADERDDLRLFDLPNIVATLESA